MAGASVSRFVTLRVKLAGFALFSILSMLVLLGIGGLYYGQIEKQVGQRHLVSEAVGKVQEVRLAEKTCLQFWTADTRQRVQRLTGEIRADYLEKYAALSGVNGKFSAYAQAFQGVLEVHDRLAEASAKLAAPLDEALRMINTVINELGEIQRTRQMEQGESLSENEREILIAAKSCAILTLQLQALLQKFLLTGSEEYVQNFNDQIKSGSDGDLLLETLSTVAKVAKNEKINTSAKRAPELIREFASQAGSVQKIFTAESAAVRALESAGQAVLQEAAEAITSANAQLEVTKRHARNVLLFITAAATCAFLIVAALLIASLLKPLSQGVGLAEAVRQGNLNQRVDFASRDELGRLGDALNAMAASLQEKAADAEAIASGDLAREVSLASAQDTLGLALREMTSRLNSTISNVNDVTSGLHLRAEQISAAGQGLSQGATKSAASLQQITASITQIDSQARGNADNAAEASRLSGQTKSTSDKGYREVQEMQSAMSEIKAAGVQISKIVKLIDDIAFQTNLLALNAAVEAARAGRHGKGFAVVAEEVRNLAGRSASAAKETATLVEGTIHKVGNGVAISARTEITLKDILGNVTKLEGLSREIATASREQAQGVTQISQGLQQIDEVTQQNTASAEETASAADELLANASHLRRLMGQFTLRQVERDPDEEVGETPAPLRLPGSTAGN